MKLSEKFLRVLVDCTDKAFYKEMTEKYNLQGLPTLAFFDAGGKKIDETCGYSPDVKSYLALMQKALGARSGDPTPSIDPNPSQDERIEKILRRIEKEMRDSEERLREDIRKIVRAELEKSGAKGAGKEKSLEAEVDAFAAKIKEDQGVNSWIRKMLLSPKGKEYVRSQMEAQGIEDFEQAVDMYFAKNEDGTYSLRPEFEEEARRMMEESEPKKDDSPKRAYLGITPDDFSDEQRQSLGLEKGHGVKILEITKGGPAEGAGVKPGDVLLSIGGKKVGDDNIGAVLGGCKPGERIAVVILRGKEKVKLEVTLAEKRD